MVDQNALIDLGFVGHAFTWTNRKVEKSNIQERLDRCFVNNEWRLLYPNMVISHLPALHLGLRQYGPGTNQRLLLLRRSSLEDTITLTFITWWQNLRMSNCLSRNGTNTSLVASKPKFWIWNSTLTISNLNLLHPFQLRWNKKTLKELDELLVRERILWKEKAKAHGWKKEMRKLTFFTSQRLFKWSTISFTIFLTV